MGPGPNPRLSKPKFWVKEDGVRRVAVGPAPSFVRVNSVTGKVYVYNSGNDTVSVVQE